LEILKENALQAARLQRHYSCSSPMSLFGIPMKSGSVIELPAARSVTTAGKRLIRGVNGRNGSQAKPLKKLTEKEEKNLQRYEAVICGHGDKFVEVGLALWSIREEELYLKTHTTFEAYCQDKFDFTANYGGRLLRSAEAVNKLEKDIKTVPIGTVVLPKTESQVRELLRVKPKDRVKVLTEAVKKSPDHPLTAELIRAAAEKLTPVKKKNWYHTPVSYTTDLKIFLAWLARLKELAESGEKKELVRQLNKAIADRAILPEMPEMVLIHAVKEPFGDLGNMSAQEVKYRGMDFKTSEHLFQWLRFEGHPKVQQKIFHRKSPMTVKMTAKSFRHLLDKPDSDVDLKIMRRCLRLKMDQHEEIKNLLQSTGHKMIVEDCSARPRGDSFYWGLANINGQWVGENWLGKLWMELREKIKP
jgi:ribA/ribD-fused uncharacterized protein